MGESNTVVSAYTMYKHLQQYCSHPSNNFTAVVLDSFESYTHLLPMVQGYLSLNLENFCKIAYFCQSTGWGFSDSSSFLLNL